MHWTLRAPELSATSRMVRICTIVDSFLSCRLGDDAADAPSFVFGKRMRLDDRHPIALGALALFIVRHETPPLFHPLAIDRMLDQAVHLDHHRFGHLGGNHGSLAPLSSLPHCSPLSPPRRAFLLSAEFLGALELAGGATFC